MKIWFCLISFFVLAAALDYPITNTVHDGGNAMMNFPIPPSYYTDNFHAAGGVLGLVDVTSTGKTAGLNVQCTSMAAVTPDSNPLPAPTGATHPYPNLKFCVTSKGSAISSTNMPAYTYCSQPFNRLNTLYNDLDMNTVHSLVVNHDWKDDVNSPDDYQFAIVFDGAQNADWTMSDAVLSIRCEFDAIPKAL